MKKKLAIVLSALICINSCSNPLGRWVDPFIGTDYTGHTAPAAACPLGMVQPGPQTGNYLWKYCSGYNWSDSLITGFTQNRLSGTGCPSLCNVLIMPFSDTHGPDYSSHKESEKASPGYYSVSLPDNKVVVGITCSPRVACYEMHFSGKQRHLFVNLQSVQIRTNSATPNVNLRGAVKEWQGEMPDSRTLLGHIKANSWVQYDFWYEISFNQDIKACDTLSLDPGFKAPAYVFDFGPGSKPL